MRKLLLAGLLVLCIAAGAAGALLFRGTPRVGPHLSATGGPKSAADAAAPPSAHAPDADDDNDDSPPAARRAGPVRAAPVWTVDKAASRLAFQGVMDGQTFDGVFRTWDAQIAFDPKTLSTSRATITVETASALTGQPLKDQALPNSEWLATEAYPQATLVTRAIRQVGPGRYQASADVKIRGVDLRTEVPFTVAISHDTGRMDATLTLDRRAFGIGEGPFRSPAPVEPTVQVTLKLVAKRSR